MQVLRFFRYIVYGVLGILSAYFATFYATAVAILPFAVVWNALSSTARVWLLVIVPVVLVIAGGAFLFISGIAKALSENYL